MPTPRSTLPLPTAAALLFAAVIVAINPGHARSEAAAACTPEGTELQMIQPTVPPTPVPDVTVLDPTGAERAVADLAAGGLVLNFWATWCAPCVREMPALDALRADLAEAGIEVVAVSEDRKGFNAIRPFYAEHGIENLEMWLDPQNRVQRAFKLRGLPTTILIDVADREIARIEGIADYESAEMRDFLERCLGD